MDEAIKPGRETLVRMAEAMAAASDGRLRLAHNEADETIEFEGEAAHFLKLDGRRLGRDLEMYDFMSTMNGSWEPVLPDVAIETVLRLRKELPAAFGIGTAHLVAMGKAVYGLDLQADWADVFVESPEQAGPVPA